MTINGPQGATDAAGGRTNPASQRPRVPSQSPPGRNAPIGPRASAGDNTNIGYWWSDPDYQWWGFTLGEARELSGNPEFSLQQAKQWALHNGYSLWQAGGKPSDRPEVDGEGYSPFIYDVSGRPQSSGGGGRGGGGVGPTYVAPDEGAVREQVKGYVVATTGTVNNQIIDKAVGIYMSEFRRGFDLRDSQQVDPWTKVREEVRGSQAYQALHELRPESVDEMDWVTGRQGKLRQLGLSATRAEEVGIELSAAGATDEALALGGSVAHATGTGRQLEFMRNRIKNASSAALGVV